MKGQTYTHHVRRLAMTRALEDVKISGKMTPEFAQILTPEALNFLVELHRQFGATRKELLELRKIRQEEINNGKFPNFLEETGQVRNSHWRVAEAPADLNDRRVEITGPVDRKMMINAFNSGANVFMADLEDSCSPTWTNVIEGQINLKEAVRRTLNFANPDGKQYKLNENIATLVVRPRGWHLEEKHVQIDGQPISASLFDFGLYFFHNAKELLERKTGPYFYLPKMESHKEARLWNDVFNFAQDKLQIPRGTIRATVLIETILAAFEMDEILFELRDHASGLNAGRWDYIFSIIKKFANHRDFCLPDRAQVTMAVPFMKAYCGLLVKTCHRRGAHAMGGMAAFIPSRKDAEINEKAMTKVREDKEREANAGFDGTWVAHPDLVAIARERFDAVLGSEPHQKHVTREEVQVNPAALLNTHIDGGEVTIAGLRGNVDVALQYIESWLRGVGAAAIHNLMEDAATAEISRAQIWQWIRHGQKLNDGRPITHELYETIVSEEMSNLNKSGQGRFVEAAEILNSLINSKEFVEFLTVPAYAYLNEEH
jgi:malate synthase